MRGFVVCGISHKRVCKEVYKKILAGLEVIYRRGL